MAPAYKVEELLALRDSVSESAVSLDKFADEDVIKEHVLRPSVSAQLIGARSDRSLRAFIPRKSALELRRETTPEVVPPIAPAASTVSYKRPSPTPSVKRGKAEQLLKEHGSPPGLRVTAGGRIVPGDLPPLGVRPSFNIYNPQTLRTTPTNIMAGQPQPIPNSTARVEVVGGQAVIVVGDRMFALPTINSATTMPVSTPVSDETMTKNVHSSASYNEKPVLGANSFAPPRSNARTPFAGLDLQALKAQQALKKQELRTVEQTEVLQSGSQTEVWRSSMIEKKRSLIVELDSLRKHITTLESDPTTVVQRKASVTAVSAIASTPSVSSFLPPYQQTLTQPMYGYAAADPYTPMMMYPPTFGAFPAFQHMDPAPFVPPAVSSLAQSPGSTHRRSRAIEIKAPHEESKKQTSSALDPKSPTYEPAYSSVKSTSFATPSSDKQSHGQHREATCSDTKSGHALSHKLSLSSVDTTDFFPNNTHEHSSTRLAPTAGTNLPGQDQTRGTPATPEKSWPASPWNEDNTRRSRNNEPTPTIGSWPEAFNKSQPLSPLTQSTMHRPPGLARGLGQQKEEGSLHTASSNTMVSRDRPKHGTATEELWPFNMPKAATHIPSTYQEGFQAGYDHLGMPDSPEVLQGYIQGILTFLADSLNNRRSSVNGRESQTRAVGSRTPSLHGLVANSTTHDSAISMTFSRSEAAFGSQENVRVGRERDVLGSRRDAAYSPQGGPHHAPTLTAHGANVMQESRQSHELSTKYPNPAGLVPPERIPNGHRHISPYPSPEAETEKPLEKGTALRSSLNASSNLFGRQTSGNQLANRTNTSAQTLQRFHPVHKEVGPSGIGGNSISTPRPFANNYIPGLDGAMDELADLVVETSIDGPGSPARHRDTSSAVSPSMDAEEMGASCFKTSSSKDKQKAVSSPVNATAASSPTKAPGSPKKSGEQSPAKAKLEQVTNKFRRYKKDDPRGMSSEEKMKRSEKWKKRFDALKQTEKAEIEEYREEEKRRNGGRR